MLFLIKGYAVDIFGSDQSCAIDEIISGPRTGEKHELLLDVTGVISQDQLD